MNEEQAFIRAIQANPEDTSVRLAYADWLEERGDVRAEFLRLEHQLSQIPARLEQLRQQIDPAWLDLVHSKCNVVLVSFRPTDKINTIKVVREVTGLGLKEAKDLVEAAPTILKGGVSRKEADRISRLFKSFATVAIEPSL